jgi:FMN reductase
VCKVLIVGLGGTTRDNSSTERAVAATLRLAAALGADTLMFSGADLQLPLYAPEHQNRSDQARFLIDQLRKADGVIVGSPGYHGGVSGLIKNALDYTEDMREDARPYLDGRAVGCIASAAGWQAATTTLVALRSIVHALRGWPTPLGVAINSTEPAFDAEGVCLSPPINNQMDLVACQVVNFALAFRLIRAAA